MSNVGLGSSFSNIVLLPFRIIWSVLTGAWYFFSKSVVLLRHVEVTSLHPRLPGYPLNPDLTHLSPGPRLTS